VRCAVYTRAYLYNSNIIYYYWRTAGNQCKTAYRLGIPYTYLFTCNKAIVTTLLCIILVTTVRLQQWLIIQYDDKCSSKDYIVLYIIYNTRAGGRVVLHFKVNYTSRIVRGFDLNNSNTLIARRVSPPGHNLEPSEPRYDIG